MKIFKPGLGLKELLFKAASDSRIIPIPPDWNTPVYILSRDRTKFHSPTRRIQGRNMTLYRYL